MTVMWSVGTDKTTAALMEVTDVVVTLPESSRNVERSRLTKQVNEGRKWAVCSESYVNTNDDTVAANVDHTPREQENGVGLQTETQTPGELILRNEINGTAQKGINLIEIASTTRETVRTYGLPGQKGQLGLYRMRGNSRLVSGRVQSPLMKRLCNGHSDQSEIDHNKMYQ